MYVLGISCFYHDSAAALLKDGQVVAAVQEERLSRVKHDPSFPRRAVQWCLDTAGIQGTDLEMLAFHEKPLQKFDRILETTAAVAPRGLKRFHESMPSWFLNKLRVEDHLRDLTGSDAPLVYAQHHESHAASAFFVSPFSSAATLTIDGVGEWATNVIGSGEDNRVSLLSELHFPHSLGLLYSAFTQYLGFRVNNGEYKVMGLAPYGEPRFRELILEHLIDVHPNGSYRLNLSHFDFLVGDSTIGPSFAEIFGVPPRPPEAPLQQHHMDLARSIQAVCEDIVLKQARTARERTGHTRLVMAGGVALNSVANGKIVREKIFEEVFIQPAAGDAGGALGAALVAWHHALDKPRVVHAPDGMRGAYLGPSYTPSEIHAAIQEEGLSATVFDDDDLFPQVASHLAEGRVVGWFQGALEYGPRALGHRSILADPRRAEMQRRVNAKIKFREGFRPFAPSVPIEDADRWFNLDGAAPYMLLVVPVRAERLRALSPEDEAKTGLDRLWVERSDIPAVTHVDGSARVQTVSRDVSPRYHRLLTTFGEQTGTPVLMNTSFNLRGEPVVCSPRDALRTFLASGMDVLVLGNHVILRPSDAEPTGLRPAPPAVPARERTTRELRTFGVGGGLILATLTALQVWWDRPTVATLVGIVALGLFLPGVFYPPSLRAIERRFASAGKTLGHINGRILLSVLYLGVLTPIAWLRRIGGADPLHPDRDADLLEGWHQASRKHQELSRYNRMF